MKKFTYAAAAIVMGLGACFTSCSSDSKTGAEGTEASAESKGFEAQDTEIAAFIRYVDMDSISTRYTLAREYAEANQRAMVQLQQYAQQQGAAVEKLQAEVQNKYQQGLYLTQASMDADVSKAQKAEQDAAQRVDARQREYQAQLAALAQQLQDSIDSFLRDYVAEKHYDAILYKAAGLYFNPALDVTDEVVERLNKRYKPAASAEK